MSRSMSPIWNDLFRSMRRTLDSGIYRQAVPNGPRIAYLKLGDTVLELTHRSDGAMSGFHFCLETDSFDAAVAELQSRGLELARAPHKTDAREPREQNWRRVVFRGADGEQMELRG